MKPYIRVLFRRSVSFSSALAGVRVTQKASVPADVVKDVAVARLSSRVITAVRTAADDLKVMAFDVGPNGELTPKGNAIGSTKISAVAVTDWPGGPGVITAVRTAAGTLKVTAWKVGNDGNVMSVGDKDAGAVSEVTISSPSGFAGIVTPVCTESGDLKVMAWKVSSSGGLTRGAADGQVGACSKIAAAALSSKSNQARIATARRNGSGNLEIIVWKVGSDGTVTKANVAKADSITDVVISVPRSPNADLVALTRGPVGQMTVTGWSIDDDQNTLHALGSAPGGNASAASVVSWNPDLHSYTVAALRPTATGNLDLLVWRDDADMKQQAAMNGSAVDSVAVTTWAKGVVTAARGGDGKLALTSWLLEQTGVPVLHREWLQSKLGVGSSSPAATETPGSDEPAPTVTSPALLTPGADGSFKPSPAWKSRFYPNVAGVDPMLAVGHKYVAVSEDHRIAFYERDGTPLMSSSGQAWNMSSYAFFGGFLLKNNADGTPNPANINLIAPTSAPIQEFYDTRVAYDSASKRFVILSGARNGKTSLPGRYVAFAVSKTDDPRDGFEQYITTESNTRDWPRMIVDGKRLLVAHNGVGNPVEGEAPVLYAFDFTALTTGDPNPPNWEYYASDVDGAPRLLIVTQPGDAGGLSFVTDVRANEPKLRIACFPRDGDPSLAPAPLLASVDLEKTAVLTGAFVVFRNNALYLSGGEFVKNAVPGESPAQYQLRFTRVPFTTATTTSLVVDKDHIVDQRFGTVAATDAPTDVVSYDKPAIAVNKDGDVFLIYGRTGVKTAAPLFSETRYTFWLHGESEQRRSAQLQAGTFQPLAADKTPQTQGRLDYATAVVDPVDDTTFWGIQEFGDTKTNNWKVVVGVVSPSGN